VPRAPPMNSSVKRESVFVSSTPETSSSSQMAARHAGMVRRHCL
jgi:hypothetical protein